MVHYSVKYRSAFCLLFTLLTTAAFSLMPPFVKGNELLCEVKVVYATKKPLGIYALSVDALVPVLLVPDGRYPVWAPDHRSFACWEGSYICIYDIKGGLPQKIFVYTPFREIVWAADSKSIIYNRFDRTTGIPSIVPTMRSGDNFSEEKPLWKRTQLEQVGRMSISAHLGKIAYEQISVAPGGIQIPIGIAIANMVNDDKPIAATPLLAPELKDRILMNPQWQPDGDLLAFEAFSAVDSSTELWIWDSRSGLFSTPDFSYGFKNSNMTKKDMKWVQMLVWSPSGKDILVAPSSVGSGISTWGPCIMSIGPDKRGLLLGGVSGPVLGGVWSSDGKAIASIHGNETWRDDTTSALLELWVAGEKPDKWERREITFPKGLVPTRISW